MKKLSALVNGKLGLRCWLVVLGILLLVGAHLSGQVSRSIWLPAMIVTLTPSLWLWYLLQGFNRTFPCPTEASLVLISVAMVPHLASYFKGTFLLLLTSVYVCLPWLHYQPKLDAPCWFHRYKMKYCRQSITSPLRLNRLLYSRPGTAFISRNWSWPVVFCWSHH